MLPQLSRNGEICNVTVFRVPPKAQQASDQEYRLSKSLFSLSITTEIMVKHDAKAMPGAAADSSSTIASYMLLQLPPDG